ncbi:hypothetical protein [Rariglobus hedericola]|uniref:Uncharacterized protein n=1 Tax=Rariglobus hedericola TaxID=2597822 RepID=A0A556QL40_9BACT|nr:hypothetical protein [Rariglobus hedericola]TSJ77359.1 hypothetical protein FPL22_14805 [Rariglobus hedericola]
MKDPRDPLPSTLQTWKHEPAPDAGFNDRVWARIRSCETTAPSIVLRFPGALPLAASLAVLLAAAAGTTTAFALNRSQSTERMAAAYARSIDPILMTDSRAVPHTHPHP